MKAAVGGLLCQSQKLRHINIDMDIAGVPLSSRTGFVIGHKLQMYLVQMETVVLDLHKTISGVFADNLVPIIILIFHFLCFTSFGTFHQPSLGNL